MGTASAQDGVWFDLKSPINNKCRKVSYEWAWYGTAPWCAGSKRDCTSRGMQFERYGSHGSSCWSGSKVLCKKLKVVKHDDCNIFCNPDKFHYKKYGTAPFCNGGDCDCWRQGEIPVGTYDQWRCPCHDRTRCPSELDHGNSKCWTGSKQVCVRPLFSTRMQLDRLKSCDFRDEQDQKTKQEALKMVSNVAAFGAEVAKNQAGSR